MADEPKTEPTAQRFTPDEVIATQRNKQLLIMVGVIVVLAVLVAITRATRDEIAPLQQVMLVGGTSEEPALKPDDIKLIQIWKGTSKDPFELKRDGEDWVVPARFGAPASKIDVDDLLEKIVKASRLSRPSTADQSQYPLYGLDDETAVHLRVEDKDNKEVFHIMLGRGETNARDFARIVGEDAPEGIFELGGQGGEYETLYGVLNLDSDGKPRASSWIDNSNFRALPIDANVETLELRDGESVIRFMRKPNTDPADDQWLLTSPREGEADGAAVHAILDVLRTYTVSDIAAPDTDAPKYGVAMPKKEVVYSYLAGDKLVTARLALGNTNDESEVAVWLKTVNKGRFIYWGGDFIIARVFRSVADLMKKERVELIPAGVNVSSLTLTDGEQSTRLLRIAEGASATWKLEKPFAIEADRLEVSNLLTGLNALQGYRTSGDIDKVGHGLGPGVSKRILTVVYPDAKPEEDDSDGDDTPEGADSEEERPEETKPEQKTATLYFGTIAQGELPVLKVTNEGEQVFWIKADAADRLFSSPSSYVKLTELQLVKPGQKLAGIVITNGAAIVQLTNDSDGDKLWHINQPWDEIADQSEASQTARAVNILQGAKLEAPLDKEQYGLGADVSTRQLDVQVSKGGEPETLSLYFGAEYMGMITGLLKRGDSEEFYLFKSGDLFQFFVSPKDMRVLPTFSGKVRHILLSWKGHSQAVVPKDPDRTEAQAWALAKEIVTRARAGEDFVELQKQYNEDGDATHVYDVSPAERLVKPFLRLASELEAGGVDMVESIYGIHVIKRIE